MTGIPRDSATAPRLASLPPACAVIGETGAATSLGAVNACRLCCGDDRLPALEVGSNDKVLGGLLEAVDCP